MKPMNHTQIRACIADACEKVEKHGYLSPEVKDRDIILLGFDFMASQICASNAGVVRIKLDGKRFFALGTAIGGIVVGAVLEFIGRLS